MEKSDFCVLIKHYFSQNKTITQTKAKLVKYDGDSAPSISMVKKWFTAFRCGRASTEDAERSGRPVEVSTPETIEKIHDMVLADRRLKVQEIVEAIGISRGSVVSILNDHLGMRKLSARWVPRLLTIDHKRNRVTGVFGFVQPQYGRVFAPFHNRGRNVDPPQHTRDQTAVKTVGFSG